MPLSYLCESRFDRRYSRVIASHAAEHQEAVPRLTAFVGVYLYDVHGEMKTGLFGRPVVEI